MKKRKMVKIALIGCGYWGEKILHYLKKDKRFSLEFICDSKTNLKKVWPKIDAVIIATPIETHFKLAKEAILNKKDVFVEKPLALKKKECIILERLAEENKIKLAVEYTQTFSYSLKKAAKIDIGKIQTIEMSVKHLGRFLEFNVYWLLASHCLSILDMFYPIENLNFEKKDFVKTKERVETGTIIFNGEISGIINLSLNYPGKEYKVIVYGEKGTIIYDAMSKPNLKSIWYKKNLKLLPFDLITKEKTWSFDEKNNLKNAIDYFYKVFDGKEITNLKRAKKITEILEKL